MVLFTDNIYIVKYIEYFKDIKSYTINGLLNDSRYIIWIRAVNDYGDSLPSPFKISSPTFFVEFKISKLGNFNPSNFFLHSISCIFFA